jgi:uncharacterized membrane-anchored protein
MKALALSALLLLSAGSRAAEAPAAAWTKGPAKVDLAGFAEIAVPEGFVFTDAKGTQALMERMGNLVTGQEAGFLAPARIFDEKAAGTWFVVFEFNPIGYVKDDEKNSIDAPALLKHMQEGNVRSNEERKRKGLEELDLTGWAVPPHYDAQTHNLEWGLLLRSKAGHESVNYEVRLLGRGGVMQSTLVLGKDGLNKTLPEFRSLLTNYAFKPGQKYAEWRQGDRLAKIGLTALIGGGAVAVAAKSGLLKYVWKYIAFIVVALAGTIRNVWQRVKRMFGKRTELD